MHGDGAQVTGAKETRTARATFLEAPALARIIDEWRDLAVNAVEPNVFYAPAMLLPALRAFAAERPEIAVVRDGAGRLIGLAPVAPQKGYSRLPVRYLATWMHKHCFFAAPLVRRGFEEEFFGALFDLIERRGAFLRLRHLDAEGPLHAAAAAVAKQTGRISSPSAGYARAMLAAPWTTDDYIKISLNGKRRKELRRLRARLEDEGSVQFEASCPGDDLEAWAEEFLALEASGWKGRRGTAMRQDPASARFFIEAVQHASSVGDVRFFRLKLSARPLAAGVNFQSGAVSFAFKIAYDEAFARFSPGVMLEIEIMQAMEGSPGLSLIDSCAKNQHPMIDRLWRGRRAIAALNISRRDGPSKSLFRLLMMLERASEAARKDKEPAEGAGDDDDL